MNNPDPRVRGIKNALKKLSKMNFLSGTPQGAGNSTLLLIKEQNMEYKIKIQKVQRPTNRSFYVNMPTPLADAIELEKSEVFEWLIEDKNTLSLKRSPFNNF